MRTLDEYGGLEAPQWDLSNFCFELACVRWSQAGLAFTKVRRRTGTSESGPANFGVCSIGNTVWGSPRAWGVQNDDFGGGVEKGGGGRKRHFAKTDIRPWPFDTEPTNLYSI